MRKVGEVLAVVSCCSLLLLACGGGGGGGSGAVAVDPGTGSGNTPTADHVIGGTVTGIASGSQIVLKNNGADALTLSADGQFSFKQRTAEGSSYSVSLSSVPSAQACTIVFSGGAVSKADVTSVRVICGPAQQGVFHLAATMHVPRTGHRLVTLSDGSVLALGGQDLAGSGVVAVERYDPVSALWKPAGTLPFQPLQAAVLLPSSGKVLVASAAAELRLYDPTTQTFTSGGQFATLTKLEQLQVLLDGRVFASDGKRVELLQPETGVWSASAAALVDHAYGGSFTLMANGNILAAGGAAGGSSTIADSEVFDPSLGKWTSAGRLATSRTNHTSTLLPNGKVLAVGGSTGSTAHYCACGWSAVAQAELFDPATGVWSSAGSLATRRQGFSVTLLPTGQVAVAGGNIWNEVDSLPTGGFGTKLPLTLGSVEAYDPSTNAWQPWGTLLSPRSGHAAVLMTSGKLLVSNGAVSTSDNPTAPDPYAWHREWVTSSEVGW